MNTAIHPPAATAADQKADSSTAAPVLLRTGEDGVAVVRFDRPGSSVNVLDTKTLKALAEILDELDGQAWRGVVFESAKPSVFIAGADLRELAGTKSRAELVDLGQQTFAKIAALKSVTVAAIHGEPRTSYAHWASRGESRPHSGLGRIDAPAAALGSSPSLEGDPARGVDAGCEGGVSRHRR